jgi:hypothetical protein
VEHADGQTTLIRLFLAFRGTMFNVNFVAVYADNVIYYINIEIPLAVSLCSSGQSFWLNV